MKIVFLLILLIINVKGEEDDWELSGNPFLTEYPCENQDIVVWFDPGLPPREKNRYYIFFNQAIIAGSVLKISFDTDVHILYTTARDYTKYAKEFLYDTEEMVLRFVTNSSGFSFIIKGALPGASPYLTSLTIDDLEYCNQPKLGFFEKYISETYTSGPYDNCGKRKINHGLVVSGAPTSPGDWPWHAAIYRIKNSIVKYICGGTLISKNFVLTAAHCGSSHGVPSKPSSLRVALGKYDLIGDDEGSEEKGVYRIILHEKFDYKKLNNDIALLQLRSAVAFTDYIQPACLWYSNVNRDKEIPVNGLYGTVVGWGFDSTDALTHELMQAKMPMVSDSTCIKSNVVYYGNVLSGNKFCAGFHNGTSPCNGDSGGGYHIFVADKSEVDEFSTGAWYVRGVVSSTISKSDRKICDPTQYTVFTDVLKYRLWIDAYLENEGDDTL